MKEDFSYKGRKNYRFSQDSANIILSARFLENLVMEYDLLCFKEIYKVTPNTQMRKS